MTQQNRTEGPLPVADRPEQWRRVANEISERRRHDGTPSDYITEGIAATLRDCARQLEESIEEDKTKGRKL